MFSGEAYLATDICSMDLVYCQGYELTVKKVIEDGTATSIIVLPEGGKVIRRSIMEYAETVRGRYMGASYLLKLRMLWYNLSYWDAFLSGQASQGVSFPSKSGHNW